jgi:glycosyltransferase involved in cell wall biosynthesis
MRVLLIAPYPALPLTHGGRVRTFRLAVALAAAGASVDLLCPWGPGLPLGRFARGGVLIETHAFASDVLPLVFRDRLLPSQVVLSWQPFHLGPRQRLRHAGRYDVVELHHVAQAGWFRHIAGQATLVYSAHNVEADYVRSGPLGASLGGYAVRRIAALERDAMARADVVVACTEYDASRLRELYGGPANGVVVPNGFDERLLALDRDRLRDEARRSLGLRDDELAVVFVGGPAHHNLDAASFLARRVLQRIARPARLVVVGECSQAVAGLPGVIPLGWVPNAAEVLVAADVAANPVAYGSGSNIKMLEYLAVGLPVVTTPFGLRGFEAFAEHVAVAELDEFPRSLGDLEPPPRAPEESLRSLTWTSLGSRLFHSYSKLLAQR